MRKTYPAIDYFKLLMAIFVVGIHRPLFSGDFANYMAGNVLFSVAVPFFFAASSFLFFRKLQQPQIKQWRVMMQYEKRLIVMYLIYTVIYLPCIFVKLHTGHYDEITARMLVSDAIFITKETVLNASFVHLWYMNTLIVSIFILFCLTRKVRNKWIVICFGALCFTGITLFQVKWDGVSRLPELLTSTLRCGLPCTCTGYFAAQSDDDCSRVKKCFLASSPILLLLVGAWAFTDQTTWAPEIRKVLSFLTAYCFLRLCIASRCRPDPWSKTIRKYSTLIYFLHLLLMGEGLQFLAVHLGLPGLIDCNFLRFSLTLFLAVTEATVIILLQKKKHFEWLRYLY